jgi:antitoxin ChpS
MMLAIPPVLLEMLDVERGDEVGLAVENGKLVAQPRMRKRYTLDGLLAQCKGRAPSTAEDRQWFRGRRAGKELI